MTTGAAPRVISESRLDFIQDRRSNLVSCTIVGVVVLDVEERHQQFCNGRDYY